MYPKCFETAIIKYACFVIAENVKMGKIMCGHPVSIDYSFSLFVSN